MDFNTLSRKMKAAQKARNALAILLALSIAGNFLQSYRISQENTQVVLIPSRVSDGMVARGAADTGKLPRAAIASNTRWTSSSTSSKARPH